MEFQSIHLTCYNAQNELLFQDSFEGEAATREAYHTSQQKFNSVRMNERHSVLGSMILPKVQESASKTFMHFIAPMSTYALGTRYVLRHPLPTGLKVAILPFAAFVDLLTLVFRILAIPAMLLQKTENKKAVEEYRTNQDHAITSRVKLIFEYSVRTEGNEKIFFDIPRSIATPFVSAFNKSEQCTGTLALKFVADVPLYSESGSSSSSKEWTSSIRPNEENLGYSREDFKAGASGAAVRLPLDLINHVIREVNTES